MWGEGVCPGQRMCVPVCVRVCQCGGTVYQCRVLASAPGCGCWRNLDRGSQPWGWWGRLAPWRSKCLARPSRPGLLREGPALGGPGVVRPWERQESGGVGGGPGPRAGRGLGGPARLTSGDSLNRAGSARDSAFLEEPERGPRQRHRPFRPPARAAAPPPSVRGAALQGPGMELPALGALRSRRT